MKPIGITMGDASGVGPEIILTAFLREELHHPFVLFGDMAALEFYSSNLGHAMCPRAALHPAEWRFSERDIRAVVAKAHWQDQRVVLTGCGNIARLAAAGWTE